MFPLAPEAGEGFFTIDRFHPAALEVIVAVVERFASLGELLQISGHCVFDEIVGGTASHGGQFLQAGFGFWPEVYFHKASLERRTACVKANLYDGAGGPPFKSSQPEGLSTSPEWNQRKGRCKLCPWNPTLAKSARMGHPAVPAKSHPRKNRQDAASAWFFAQILGRHSCFLTALAATVLR